ncbi:635_t:CDS:2 [Acaulospora colombiana]|uniref:635_t:CDS:1 n=1 Tax=Acaulospora colombiana TaxID=27376 RepID=A0ACA9NDZ4_9GLOM|nr:635_t:CDS:2 [Acaulospora colombiana]
MGTIIINLDIVHMMYNDPKKRKKFVDELMKYNDLCKLHCTIDSSDEDEIIRRSKRKHAKTEYNEFLSTEMRKITSINPDISHTDSFKMAVEEWNNRKQFSEVNCINALIAKLRTENTALTNNNPRIVVAEKQANDILNNLGIKIEMEDTFETKMGKIVKVSAEVKAIKSSEVIRITSMIRGLQREINFIDKKVNKILTNFEESYSIDETLRSKIERIVRISKDASFMV